MNKLWLCALFYFASAADVLAAKKGDGDHGSGGLPQLDPSSYTSQVFWLVIVFSTLYFFFSQKSLPDISQVLENRKERVRSDLDTAEKLRHEVETVQAAYEKSLAEARSTAAKSFQDVEKNLAKQAEEQQQALKEKAVTEASALEQRIFAAVEGVMSEMEKIAADIAIEAAEKIIGERVEPKDALAIVASLGKGGVTKKSKAA